jgi:isoleucyl-tRNA synthetase
VSKVNNGRTLRTRIKAFMDEQVKMTKMERVELTQLVRKRERVLKASAEQRAYEMLAAFEQQSAAIYSFDQEEIWENATKEAQKVVAEANKRIAERCKEMGIPEEFAPGLHLGWNDRGQNAVAGRRAELRRVAKSKIDAIQQETKTRIERMSLDAQTAIVATGLESSAAKAFLNDMPTIDALMPLLDITQVKQVTDQKRKDRHRFFGYVE